MKKIGRIKKGEQVLVQVLPEDIQDLFDKMCDLKTDYERALEAYNEDSTNVELAKQRVLVSYAAETSRIDFWRAVHTRYGNWEKNLGVRDGYSLVTFADKESGFDSVMRRIMKDMQGESDS